MWTKPNSNESIASIIQGIDIHNTTALDTGELVRLCKEAVSGWCFGPATVRVRYSRGADFSGTCFYADGRIYINLGRHLTYPYRMPTHIARARAIGNRWRKPVFTVEVRDGYGVVLFVLRHEIYHLLVRRVGRNHRQKESMCDRFATRFLVDHFGATVRDERDRLIARDAWDFQDIEGFVAAARGRMSKNNRVPTKVGIVAR